MFPAPETLARHELERKLRRARTTNLLLGALAVLGLGFGAVQLAQQPSGSPGQVPAAGAGASGQAQTESSSPAETSQAGGPSLERRIDGDPMAIGALDATVVLSEWIDYRCPFCAVFSRDTFPQILREYVDSGAVRIEIHDVAFFGDESARAAVAARAAGEQGRYFEFLEAVYAVAPEQGHPELPTEQLIELAATAGVPDLTRFTEDLQREDLLVAVQQSTANAQRIGVTGVPFFAVSGQAMSGAQPIETFREFLNQHVAVG